MTTPTVVVVETPAEEPPPEPTPAPPVVVVEAPSAPESSDALLQIATQIGAMQSTMAGLIESIARIETAIADLEIAQAGEIAEEAIEETAPEPEVIEEVKQPPLEAETIPPEPAVLEEPAPRRIRKSRWI